jgi:hypothetical protein
MLPANKPVLLKPKLLRQVLFGLEIITLESTFPRNDKASAQTYYAGEKIIVISKLE